MFDFLVILSAIARSEGSGVGLAVLCDETGKSRHKVRKMLKDLVSVGAIVRQANRYQLTLLGANLVTADHAASKGYETNWADAGSNGWPIYQKGI